MDLNLIIDIVKDVSGIDPRKKTRKREYVYARAIYYKIARDVTSYSLSRIGGAMGKNHATVLHNINVNFDIIEAYDPHFYGVYESARDIVYKKLMKRKKQVRKEVEKKIENHYLEENSNLRIENAKLKEELSRLRNLTDDSEVSEMIKRVPSKNMKHFLFRLDNLTDIMAKL